MASRISDITALISHCRKSIIQIEEHYNQSLKNTSISMELKIEIKSLFENLRSILDYLAHDIKDQFCQAPESKERFYFPIFRDRKTFEARMSEWFPGLQKSAPKMWKYLETIQPYYHDQQWLGYFNAINNENKHDHLIEQIMKTSREVRATSGDSRVSWKPGSVNFGKGVKIQGVPVDPATQLPVAHPSQNVEQITWVDFLFEGINVSALLIMKSAIDGIDDISSNVYSIIDETSAG